MITIEWKATAIGKNMESAKNFLEKNYNADMLLEEAIQSALKGLKEGFQGMLSINEGGGGVVYQILEYAIVYVCVCISF